MLLFRQSFKISYVQNETRLHSDGACAASPMGATSNTREKRC
jgi:hypothetical protein